MNNRSTLFALIVGCMVTGWVLQPVLAGKGNGKGRNGGGSTVVVTEDEAVDLLFMREEEKLARDVYINLYIMWGNSVFDTISESEQKHTDAILALLDKYGLPDPAVGNGIGVFTSDELQGLYDVLMAKGEVSMLDALMVGAEIEEVDIEDIVDAMTRTDKSDILNVYGNLLAGSENHLRAFVKNIEALTGETYVAQYIDPAEVNAILGR